MAWVRATVFLVFYIMYVIYIRIFMYIFGITISISISMHSAIKYWHLIMINNLTAFFLWLFIWLVFIVPRSNWPFRPINHSNFKLKTGYCQRRQPNWFDIIISFFFFASSVCEIWRRCLAYENFFYQSQIRIKECCPKFWQMPQFASLRSYFVDYCDTKCLQRMLVMIREKQLQPLWPSKNRLEVSSFQFSFSFRLQIENFVYYHLRSLCTASVPSFFTCFIFIFILFAGA